MAKYRSHGKLDDPTVTDGDLGFVGIDQLADSAHLKVGRYRDGQNIRIKGGKIKTRDGLEAHNYYDTHYQEGLVTNRATLKMMVYESYKYGFSALIGFTGSDYLGKVSHPAFTDSNGVTHERVPRSDFSLPHSYAANWDTFPNYVDYGTQLIQVQDKVLVFPAYKTGHRPSTLDPANPAIQPPASVFLELPATNGNWLTNDSGDYIDLSGNVVSAAQRIQDPSIIVCPAAPFGIYYQNRLIVPRYETSSTTTIISDILDINSFPLTNEFSANEGLADITLGYAPILEDQLLVLNKNSIHVIQGITNGGERISEITRQHGIAGHSAYATNGSYIYFVSSEGNMEVLVPQIDPAKGIGVAVTKMNLDKQPLSETVEDVMSRVNLDAIDTSVVHYHKNLVYFALPIDGARLASAILIYDSLQSAFIGVDTFNFVPDSTNSASDSSIHRLLVHDIKTFKHEVWLSTNLGLFKYKKGQHSDAGWEISTKFKTRDYLCKDGYGGTVKSVKKFTKGSINYSAEPVTDLSSAAGSKLEVKVNANSPSVSNQLCKSIDVTKSIDDNLSSFNISRRGQSVNVEVSANCPIVIDNINVDGFVANARSVGDFE